MTTYTFPTRYSNLVYYECGRLYSSSFNRYGQKSSACVIGSLYRARERSCSKGSAVQRVRFCSRKAAKNAEHSARYAGVCACPSTRPWRCTTLPLGQRCDETISHTAVWHYAWPLKGVQTASRCFDMEPLKRSERSLVGAFSRRKQSREVDRV